MIETLISSSVLIIFLSILRFILKGKINSRLQYALWGLVILKLFIPNILLHQGSIQSSYSVMNSVESIKENVITNTNLEPIVTNITTGVMYRNEEATSPFIRLAAIDWQLIIMIVWILGAISILIVMFVINRRFGKYLSKNGIVVSKAEYPLLIYVVPNLYSPCLYSMNGTPTVFITTDLWKDEEQLEHVLIHELCHYKHYDHVWSVIRCGFVAFYWINPFVWLAAYLSKRDCELACDEAAIQLLGEENRIKYGYTILGLVTKNMSAFDFMKTATTMTSSKKAMKERMKLIAKKPTMLLSTVLVLMIIIVAVVMITFTSAKKDTDLPYPSIDNIFSDSSVTETEQSDPVEEVVKIAPTKAQWTKDMNMGADPPVLDYASEDYIIFHGYFGLFVYDLNKRTISRAIDLKTIGCNATQGDNYNEVNVSKDGKMVYLHPISEDMMYVYAVEENVFYYQPYMEIDTPFDDFVPIEEVVGNAESTSYNAVKVTVSGNYEYYGYLTFYDWKLGSLEYVVDDMVFEPFIEK